MPRPGDVGAKIQTPRDRVAYLRAALSGRKLQGIIATQLAAEGLITPGKFRDYVTLAGQRLVQADDERRGA